MIVIGAGPAGSSAGFHLARRGFEVTIVESRPFPRMKVCGEFISPAATRDLESIVPAGELLRAGARRVERMVLELGEREESWRMPAPAWALSRGTLDGLLLSKARGAGATVIQPGVVRAVEYRRDGVEVRLASGWRLAADWVVHADGHGRHDPAGPTPMRAGVLGQKCHLRAPGGGGGGIDAVRMRAGAGAYVGLIEVEDGLATCALVARRSLVARFRGDTDALVRSLWPAYDPAWRVGEWQSCGVGASGYITPGHPRSFRVGNAAVAVEPIGGEGIGLALWAGATLGAMLGNETAQRQMARAYRSRLRARRPACRGAAAVVMRPWLVRALWPALGSPALTMRPWWALTGKPARAVKSSS